MARPVYLLKRCDCTCATQVTPCECPPPAGCFLTMPTILIDGDDTPYADEAAAIAALAAQAGDCLAELAATIPGASSYSRSLIDVAFAAGELSLHTQHALTGLSGSAEQALVKLVFASAATISVRGAATFTSSNPGPYTSGFNADLYTDMPFPVDSNGSGVGALTYDDTVTLSVPEAGTYYLLLNAGGGEDGSTSGSGTGDTLFEITADQPFDVCAVRAAHGGTPDYVVCTP